MLIMLPVVAVNQNGQLVEYLALWICWGLGTHVRVSVVRWRPLGWEAGAESRGGGPAHLRVGRTGGLSSSLGAGRCVLIVAFVEGWGPSLAGWCRCGGQPNHPGLDPDHCCGPDARCMA